MKLTFLGTCDGNDCPTLYATDRGTLVVQGWKLTDAGVRAQAGNLPDHEDLVEIPAELLEFGQQGS